MVEPVKIAYIIQFHKNAKQVNGLLLQLLNDNVDIYVHIDKKWSDGVLEILKHPQVMIIPQTESIDVQWGNISQVQATLLLIESVFKAEKEYDYIWFISGQDFPIKTLKEIDEFLSIDKTRAFINMSNIPYAEKRNEIYYPNWMLKRKFLSRGFKYIWVKVSGGKKHTYKLFQRKKPFEKFYYGSCWWCLPYDCVKELYEIIKNNPSYLEFFSHSLCSDESFFQTLFMQTSYKDKSNDYLVYVDWSELKSSPRILTEKDFDFLTNQREYFFARKFDIDIDEEILKKLKEYLK